MYNDYCVKFQVINSQYQFDDTYMMCVAQHMDEVMPFGEDPRKLASTVKRSMVAVRALEKALKSGYKIAEEMKKVIIIKFQFYKLHMPFIECVSNQHKITSNTFVIVLILDLHLSSLCALTKIGSFPVSCRFLLAKNV